jgi:hypothetical protein
MMMEEDPWGRPLLEFDPKIRRVIFFILNF